MATSLQSLFGQTPQTQTPSIYSGGGLTYDPSIYQGALRNSDQFAIGQGWSGLDSLGAGASINGTIGDSNNPSGYYASRSLQPGDTRNGYEINTLSFNPDGTIKYDPNSWSYQERAPDGGWLKPAATWAGMALGTYGLGSALSGLAAGAGGAAGAGTAAGTGSGSSLYSLGAPEAAGMGGTAGGGLNLGGTAAGTVTGTGAGLGISGGTGLGAGIGASIPAGSALAGTALGGAGAGTGSGLASQFLGTGADGLSGAVNTLKNIPGVSGMGNSVVGKLLGSVLGGTGQGVSGLGNLGSLFSNYQQYDQNKDLINEIKSIYKPDGQYAKYMEEQLGRRDAAAGRNSQYGPRLAELMGKLGDSQARALSNLSGYMNSQQGGLNGMLGAGQRLFEGSGGLESLLKYLGSGSQGGMIPTPTTDGGPYVPNPDYNPVDDDWWSNPQYGP